MLIPRIKVVASATDAGHDARVTKSGKVFEGNPTKFTPASETVCVWSANKEIPCVFARFVAIMAASATDAAAVWSPAEMSARVRVGRPIIWNPCMLNSSETTTLSRGIVAIFDTQRLVAAS